MARPTNLLLSLKALVRAEVQREVVLPLLRFGEKKSAKPVEVPKVRKTGND